MAFGRFLAEGKHVAEERVLLQRAQNRIDCGVATSHCERLKRLQDLVLVEGVVDDVRQDALLVKNHIAAVRGVFGTVGDTVPWAGQVHW